MAKAVFKEMQDRLGPGARPQPVGRIVAIDPATITLEGIGSVGRIGDRLRLLSPLSDGFFAQIVRISGDRTIALPDGPSTGLRTGQRMLLEGRAGIAPSAAWLGRVVDPFGAPLDGKPLAPGAVPLAIEGPPPPPVARRAFGDRLSTGLRAFNTFLPLVRGQRVGLFAGSGVGKSTLLGQFCRGVSADVVVVGLIGERGREVRHFAEEVLGAEGLARTVIVAATSDRPAQERRRCAFSAMAVAEYFRDQGNNVLLIVDSITRLAEAHREIATAAGESAALRGFPPSTAHTLTSLCERAGTGAGASGDITAVFSVLVAGSDMEEPVADMLRGVLDGHVVLDRSIAERGRFPAVDLSRSVSRALPGAASDDENARLMEARRRLALYEKSEMMVQAGLYTTGTDAVIDEAIASFPLIDAFLAEDEPDGIEESFTRLGSVLSLGARKAWASLGKSAG
ncbi:FliI/YscN family ATPase [Aestuariibius sp. 2305UL40-4]|uniref:FliI/YscN family ATPase n=1 Tax=Aestuariibius violaceus TaxID=3234132 RepID=UPI00345E892F